MGIVGLYFLSSPIDCCPPKEIGYCGLSHVVDNSDIMSSSYHCNWGIVLKTGVGFSHIFTFRMFTKFCQPFEEVM